jgi:hypothetical protein
LDDPAVHAAAGVRRCPNIIAFDPSSALMWSFQQVLCLVESDVGWLLTVVVAAAANERRFPHPNHALEALLLLGDDHHYERMDVCAVGIVFIIFPDPKRGKFIFWYISIRSSAVGSDKRRPFYPDSRQGFFWLL